MYDNLLSLMINQCCHSLFDMALLMKKYIFQINLGDTEFVIFTELTVNRILNKSWSISDEDAQENVLDSYSLSKLVLSSVV